MYVYWRCAVKIYQPCFFNFSDYMRRAVESAQEAFQMYDNEPEDMQLTYQELQKVSLKVI